MTQYLLTIYQPDGGPPPPEFMEPVIRELHALNQELKAAGAWVFSRRAARPEHGHGGAGPRRRDRDHRRPLRRGQGAHRRLLDHRGARPRRRPRLGAQGGPGDHRCRSRCVRSRTTPSTEPRLGSRARRRRSSACSARSTAARWPSWSASSATSTSPRRRCRTRSPRPCERWPTDGLPPSPAGWIITTARNRAIDRLRREASRADRHAQAALLHARDEPRRGGAGAGRAAAADLHLLPPGARPRRAGRADAAAPRRAHAPRRSRGPSSCRSRRWRSGWCGPRARSATRSIPYRVPAAAELAEPAAVRAGRRLPHLQRGLHGQLGSASWCAPTSAPRRSGSAACSPS